MNILITTPLTGLDVGGPAQYGPRLMEEFEAMGYRVRLLSYSLEKKLPIIIRHVFFLLKILPYTVWADRIITLDTFSVGLPSVCAARFFRKKIFVRIGGDFLWEGYVNRTGDLITLKDFYKNKQPLNLKEKLIFLLTRFITNNSDALIFNTDWLKDIWMIPYKINIHKTHVVRHPIPEKNISNGFLDKTFLWAGRINKVKNFEMIKNISEHIKTKCPEFKLEIVTNQSRDYVLEKIKKAYAVFLPSLSDTCPLFVIEAASMGKPFIVTKETGLRELYKTGGIFVDPKSEEDIINAIKDLLDENIYKEHLSELKSYNLVRTWSVVAREIMSI